MSEMVERVAAAILAKVPFGYGMTKLESVEYARAAVEAMRDPIEAMSWAYTQSACNRSGSPEAGLDIWAYEAMIDAALTPPETSS